MKKICFFIVVILLILTPGAQAEEVSGGASVDVMSNYVWRGFKLSEEMVIQPSAGITYGGFGANLWANYDTELEELNETDMALNYTFLVEKFDFDVGYIYYGLDSANDTQEIYVSIGYNILLSPTLTLYYDFDEGEGAFITASIGHDIELSNGIALSLGALVSYNANSEYSIGDYSDFHNGGLSASVSIPVSKNITVEPMIAYSFPLSEEAEDAIEAISDDGDSHIFYGGIKVALEF